MTDPYNSYLTHTPVHAPAAANAQTQTSAPPPRPQRDTISRLPISDTWKARFRAIEKAGGAELPNQRDLSRAERRAIGFNGFAFFFGPFYYLAKGLWRQAVVYLLLGMAFMLLLDAMGFDKFAHVSGYGFAALYAMRANLSYYKRLVLDAPPWF